MVAAVALVAALGFAWWSGRQDPPPPPRAHAAATTEREHPAPFEAFSHAQVGDWYAVKRVVGQPPGTQWALIDKQPPPGDVEVSVVFRVAAVEGDRITRTMRGRVVATGEIKNEPEDTFPRTGLTLERLTGFDHAEWKLGDVAVSDDTRTIAGRAFPCKKVMFHPSDPLLPRKRTTTEIWYSPDVPAGGLVAEREVQDVDAMHFESTEELVGFGSAGGATWGTLPEGL